MLILLSTNKLGCICIFLDQSILIPIDSISVRVGLIVPRSFKIFNISHRFAHLFRHPLLHPLSPRSCSGIRSFETSSSSYFITPWSLWIFNQKYSIVIWCKIFLGDVIIMVRINRVIISLWTVLFGGSHSHMIRVHILQPILSTVFSMRSELLIFWAGEWLCCYSFSIYLFL